MNNAAAKVLFLVAAALGGPYVGNELINAPPPEPPAIVVPGEVVQVGQLITLTCPGHGVEWYLETEDYVRVSPNSIAVSFRSPGEHEVVASAIVNGRAKIDKVYVQVGGPEPGPEPGPKSELSTLVYQWCAEYDAPRECSATLYKNFTDAASTSSTVEELVTKTARANSSVTGCSEVLGKVQAYLLKNYKDRSFVDHQCAWDEIAQGFLHWSEK